MRDQVIGKKKEYSFQGFLLQ